MIRMLALSLVLAMTTPAFAAADKDDSKKTVKTNNQDKDKDTSGKSYSCGSKSRCDQMTTCEEAKYYLQTCKIGSLDRDKDGVPCESLCK